MLLYSNEIQHSLRYYGELNEKLSEERIEEEDVKSRIQEEKTNISFQNNNISNLKEIKERIDYTKVIKHPTPSIDPVFPRKKLIVLIAGILGLMVFIPLAFFIYYIEKRKT
jgi:LPS O-antigen subunit length determinant protein (WzzB/FepE family)